SQSGTITISAVNDAPVLGGTAGGAYTEQGAAMALITGATLVDESAVYGASATLTVSFAAYQTGDVLSINNQGVGAGQIGVSGSNVTYGGVTIGTFAGGGASNLVVTFNGSASATGAAVQ